MMDPASRKWLASRPMMHSSLTRCQEILSIDLLDLWAELIPYFLKCPTYHFGIGDTSLEETGLDDSYLHPKVGELSPARHTDRRAKTSEDLHNKTL